MWATGEIQTSSTSMHWKHLKHMNNCGSPLNIGLQQDHWRVSSEKWQDNTHPDKSLKTSLKILMCPDLFLLPHAAQAHPLLLMVCADGSSKIFLSDILLWDTFAANYMASFSKRQRSHIQLWSGLVTSYCVIPKTGCNNGGNVRDWYNSNLTI